MNEPETKKPALTNIIWSVIFIVCLGIIVYFWDR